MNKADIIAEMADAAGVSKAVAGKALDGMLGAIEGALKDGDKVTLVGFGTFSVAKRAARTGRNPQTKEEIKIPAANVPKFKPGNRLKDVVK
ncbi:MAG: HU family DNA-binding protein [Deltaproteobacteria bacterium]|nr:HU family DNA-binding protein [Deltaproteobacteria bacterium]